jgi:hypothetical protein
LLLGVFQAVADFIEDVEVILDVLKRAVFGGVMKEGFDLLFGGGHYEVRIAWRPQNPGLAKAARLFDSAQGRLWGTLRQAPTCQSS